MGDLFSVVLVGVVLAVVDPVLAVVVRRLLRRGHASGTTGGAPRVMDRAAYEVHVGQAVDLRTIQQPLAAVKDVKLRGARGPLRRRRVRRADPPPPAAPRDGAVERAARATCSSSRWSGAAALIALVAFTTQPVGTATATVGVFLVGGFRMLAPLNKVIFGFTQARGALPSLDQVRADLEPRARSPPRSSRCAGTPGELRPTDPRSAT